MSNYSTLCPATPILRTFVQCLIAFCNLPEVASDVISGKFLRPVVLNKCVNFRDPGLECSREIPPEAGGGGIFDSFFAITCDRK